jgi:thiosulfate/3-mercaptopyruvate sulfurtransferase
MPYAHPESLVDTAWLAERLGEPGVKVVDASWYLPAMNRDAKAEYLAGHIPGAVPFDLDAVSDRSSSLPHMFPDADAFTRAVGAMGIGRDDHVVVYDGTGFFSAPRVWYTFRLFGHARVSVLDGGMPKWKREGRPLEAGETKTTPKEYTARALTPLVRDKGQMLANLGTRHEQVVDARAAARFAGEEPDVWPGRRRGHVPGARNLPYGALVDARSGTFLDAEALRRKFVEAGLDLDAPIVASCGSGVTAAVLAFGLHLIGQERVALYDGSWAEWGLPGDAPVETGPATPRSSA